MPRSYWIRVKPKTSARALNMWLDLQLPKASAEVAWKLGQEKFNWDLESKKLVSSVIELLKPRTFGKD